MFTSKPSSAFRRSFMVLPRCVVAWCAIGGGLAWASDGEPPPKRVATPSARPLNARLEPASMAAAAAYSEAHGGRAVLVMQRGEVIFEQYAKGWNGDRPHPLASGTKSFNGVLAMCAIEDGLITSLDEKICETILEWKDDPRKSQITVRHLLTLSSGLVPNDGSLGSQGAGIRDLTEAADGKRDGPIARRLRERVQSEKPADRFAAAVGVPTEGEPGKRFHYGPSHFYAFGEFLERKLKASSRPERTYFDYLRNRVLMPCGIDVGIDRFAPDAANRPALPSGGHLSAHEWVRFGEMVRRGGVVGGLATKEHAATDPAVTLPAATGPAVKEPSAKDQAPSGPAATPETRVLAPSSLAQCFKPSATNPAYGLTWWIVTGQAGAVARVADTGGIAGRAAENREGDRDGDGVTRGGGIERPKQPPAAARLEPVRDANGKPVEIVMAAGAGGQRLYVIPQADLVVVRFAALGKPGQSYDDATFLRAMLNLPAAGDSAEHGAAGKREASDGKKLLQPTSSPGER